VTNVSGVIFVSDQHSVIQNEESAECLIFFCDSGIFGIEVNQ